MFRSLCSKPLSSIVELVIFGSASEFHNDDFDGRRWAMEMSLASSSTSVILRSPTPAAPEFCREARGSLEFWLYHGSHTAQGHLCGACSQRFYLLRSNAIHSLIFLVIVFLNILDVWKQDIVLVWQEVTRSFNIVHSLFKSSNSAFKGSIITEIISLLTSLISSFFHNLRISATVRAISITNTEYWEI